MVSQAIEIALYNGDGSEDLGFGEGVGFLNDNGHHDVNQLFVG